MISKEYFGEGKNIEFKQEIPSNHEKFLKDIIAFANTSGGKSIIGIVDETKEVIGIGEQNPFKLSDSISSMISDACTPFIDNDIYPQTVEGKTVLVVEVFPGKHRPYYLKKKGKEDTSYVRVNGTSRPADPSKLKELELEGDNLSYDSMPEIGAKYDENRALELCKQVKEIALSNCENDDEKVAVKDMTIGKLEDIGLLCRNGRDLIPTHAFSLMTDNRSQYAKVQCALFKGNSRDMFIDKKEFDGPIYEQLTDSYNFVLKHINTGARIEGLYRKDTYELPIKSIRELLANAIIHRSYLAESKIQVSIYDERIEVVSPGTLYAGMNFEHMKSGRSKCRNQAIANIFQYMHIIEAWGTGIPRLIDACKQYGLQEPSFEEFGDGIKVIVYRKQANTESNTPNNTQLSPNNTQLPPNGNQLSPNDTQSATDSSNIEDMIIDHLKKYPTDSQSRTASAIGQNPNTVKSAFSRLKEKGTIEWDGENKKTGHWIIKANYKN